MAKTPRVRSRDAETIVTLLGVRRDERTHAPDHFVPGRGRAELSGLED